MVNMSSKGLSKYFLLVSVLALSFIVPTTWAEDPADPPPDDPAAAADPAAPAAPTGNGTLPMPEPEEDKPMTPEEMKVVEEINKLVGDQCVLILGDCWIQLQAKKPWIKEEKRLAMCLKQTQGFMMCNQMKPEDAETAKTAAEERVAKAREQEEEEARKKAEMAEKAEQRAEEMKMQQEKLMEERARRKEEKEAQKAAAAEEGEEAALKASAEMSFDNLEAEDDS